MIFSRVVVACAMTLMGAGPTASKPVAPRPAQPRVALQAIDAGVAPAADAGVPEARPAMDPEVKALVDRMQAFYETTRDFTAQFRQDYTYKAFKRTQSSSGTVTYRKPALMRWEYQAPSPRTFVLAGDRVFAHDPEAKLLTRAALATNQLSASVTFLWGQGKLADEFHIVRKPCDKCLGAALELTPLRPDPRFKRITLEVDEQTAQVRRSTVVDPDGSENAITFLELKPNVGIDEKHFRLAPPPGTQVQDFLTASGAPSTRDGGAATP